MHLTLIAYRPNSDDYCMGCHMGSSDSDMDIYHTDDPEEAAKWLGYFMFQNDIKELEEADYEFTLLQDGIDSTEQSYGRVLRSSIFDEAYRNAGQRMVEHEEQLAAREVERAKKKEEEQEAKDRLELARLQEKLQKKL